MVDVNGVIEIGVEIDGRPGNKIFASALHQERGQSFVGCGASSLQREETAGCEAGIFDGAGIVSAVHPRDDIGEVLAEPGFVGPAVEFAEDPAPVPVQDFLFDAGVVDVFGETRTDAGKGDELGRIGKEAGIKDFFFGEKLCGFLEAVFQFIGELLVIGNRQFQDVPAFTRDGA